MSPTVFNPRPQQLASQHSGSLSVTISRTVAIAAVVLALATPASAQFGALKKKLKAEAAAKAVSTVETDATAEPAGAGDGGTLVLTADVLDRLVTGLKAGEAERELATKEDTPYGRYQRARAGYEVAQPECQQAQQTFPNRMAADEKMADKYSKLVDKMVDAQGKGDNRATAVYSDSAMAMMDPSCTVKQPQQPDDYYQAQRDIDNRVEQETMKKSGFNRSELGQVRERAEAILRGATPPGDASASEKDAIFARSGELKPLLGIRDAQKTARTPKAAPTPAPAPAPAPSRPAAAVPAGAIALQECMTQNVQKHEPEIRALGERGEAAHKAGNTAAMMAIADTLQRLQMAGCMGAR